MKSMLYLSTDSNRKGWNHLLKKIKLMLWEQVCSQLLRQVLYDRLTFSCTSQENTGDWVQNFKDWSQWSDSRPSLTWVNDCSMTFSTKVGIIPQIFVNDCLDTGYGKLGYNRRRQVRQILYAVDEWKSYFIMEVETKSILHKYQLSLFYSTQS